MSFPVPPQPDPRSDADRPVPQDVTTAFQLWCGVLVLAAVSLVLSLVDVWGQRAVLLDLFVEMSDDPAMEGITEADLEGVLPVVLGFTAVLGLAVLGLLYFFARRMRSGKNWARMVLTLIGVFMTLTTLPTVFGLGAEQGVLGMAGSIVSILQAVATVGAIVLLHRRDSNLYFLRLPG